MASKTATLVIAVLLAVVMSGCAILSSDPTGYSRVSISSVSPGTAKVATQTTLQIGGDGFTRDSLAIWNGLAKPTAFINEQLIAVSLSPADLTQPADANLQVHDLKASSNSVKVKVVGKLGITTIALPNAVQGSGYTASVQSSGGAKPIKWTANSALPSGLALTSSGTVTGTPTQAGLYSFVVTAVDGSTPTQSASATISIKITSSSNSPLSETTSALPAATVGSSYSIVLPVSGGTGPYKWSNPAGLPPGMTLASNGVFSGTPTTMGTSQVTAVVTDSSSPAQSINSAYQISVNSAVAPLIVATSTLPAAQAGTSYSTRLSGSGGTTPYAWSATTSVPPGLSLSPDGTLSGTPSAAGNFSIGVRLQDNSSPQEIASTTLSLSVTNPPSTLAVSGTSLPSGTVGTTYSSALSASGGTLPYSWTIQSGQLPPGLTLSSSGILSGTPSSAGSYTFTPKVTDSSSSPLTASTSMSISVVTSSATSGPSSSTPTVSNVTHTVTPTSATVTWNTDVPSDSMVFYGYTDSYGSDQGVKDTAYTQCGPCVHTQTISNLLPGKTYWFGVRSRGFSNGAPDNNKVGFSYGYYFQTAAAPSSGTLDYWFIPYGPHHVVAGYELYTYLQMGILQGTRDYVNISVSGLPPGSTVHFPDQESGAVCCSFGSSSVRMWDPENTQVEITTSNTTPPGTYTVQFNVTTDSGVPAAKNVTWSVIVDQPPSFAFGTPASYPSIPDLATWESNMTTYGQEWCRDDYDNSNTIGPNDNSNLCGVGAENCSWYYDGERVYYQIADYTNNAATWNICAKNSETFYEDGYVLTQPGPGGVTGWRVFPHGLYMDYLRTGDTQSKASVDLMAKHSAFAVNGQLVGGALISPDFTRETSYKINVNRLDVDLGVAGQDATTKRAVDYALGHVDMWAVDSNGTYIQPFMVGLNAEALIQYYEDGHQSDTRIPVAIKMMADWLWNNAWIPPDPTESQGTGTFYYNSYLQSIHVVDVRNDYRDLNLLIAPMYAWLYKATGDPIYQTRGDIIWDQGVRHANVGWNGKIFSQNYRWSFDYVKWRKGQ